MIWTLFYQTLCRIQTSYSVWVFFIKFFANIFTRVPESICPTLIVAKCKSWKCSITPEPELSPAYLFLIVWIYLNAALLYTPLLTLDYIQEIVWKRWHNIYQPSGLRFFEFTKFGLKIKLLFLIQMLRFKTRL